MKAKYLFLIALNCIVMISCQGNVPDSVQDMNNGKDDKQSSGVVERLDGLVDSIGSIVSSVTQEDGSIVMTDDQGNTITKDTEGNITILTKNGVVILVDYSVNEDSSAAKDKWYDSKWSGKRNKISSLDVDEFHEFLQRLKMYGFQMETQTFMKDSIVTYIVNGNLYNMSLKSTTCAIQKTETQTNYIYDRRYNFVQYVVSPDIVEKQGTTYRYAVLTEDTHLYSHVVYRNEKMYDRYLSVDSVLTDVINFGDIYMQEKILSRSDTTTLYNYRRLDDTQFAVYNNSESYIFKEITDRSKPYLSMLDMNGNEIMVFELISF